MLHILECFIMLVYYIIPMQSILQNGHSSGKLGKVRELKSGQGKVRENELLQLFSCRDYCSDSNR